MKVGKLVAISVGGSIILLQIASNEGYIQIDWSKITKNANKIADKAEEAITGEGPSWAEKVSFVFVPCVQNCAVLDGRVRSEDEWNLKNLRLFSDQIVREGKFIRDDFVYWWISDGNQFLMKLHYRSSNRIL